MSKNVCKNCYPDTILSIANGLSSFKEHQVLNNLYAKENGFVLAY